jgi:hypothetical protein
MGDATNHGYVFIMEDGETIVVGGDNGEHGQDFLSLRKDGVISTPTPINLRQLGVLRPNEVLTGFVIKYMADNDMVVLQTSDGSDIGFGLNIISPNIGTTAVRLTPLHTTQFVTTYDGAYFTVPNVWSHKIDWKFFGNNDTNGVFGAPGGQISYLHSYLMFSTVK